MARTKQSARKSTGGPRPPMFGGKGVYLGMKAGAMLVRFEEAPKEAPKEDPKEEAPGAKREEAPEAPAKRQCVGIELKPCAEPCELDFSDSED